MQMELITETMELFKGGTGGRATSQESGEGAHLRAKRPFSILLEQKGLYMQKSSRGLFPSLLKAEIQLL